MEPNKKRRKKKKGKKMAVKSGLLGSDRFNEKKDSSFRKMIRERADALEHKANEYIERIQRHDIDWCSDAGEEIYSKLLRLDGAIMEFDRLLAKTKGDA